MFKESDIVLSAKHIVKQFPASHGRTLTACNDINLNVYKGKTLGIVGESGCGKSTFVRMVISLDKPTSGEILYHGKNLADLSKKETWLNRQNMQMVFQDPYGSLNPRMKVQDLIGEPLLIHTNMSAGERLKKVHELLGTVGLSPSHGERYPHEFSGGQRQRIGIARALTVQPKLIIADEPVSALDVSIQAQVLNLLQQLQKDFNLTYLFISHDLSVVEMISDRIGVMYLGGLVETGTTADIFANPQSEVAKELIRKDTGSDIDADSRLDAVREKGQAEIKSGEKIRIVFSENSAFEPVIANLILTFGEPVNILKADTKNVGGVAKGEMILEFMEGSTRTEMMKQYLKEKGLAIGEVTEYVGS